MQVWRLDDTHAVARPFRVVFKPASTDALFGGVLVGTEMRNFKDYCRSTLALAAV